MSSKPLFSERHRDTQGNLKLNSVFDSLSAQIAQLTEENNEMQEANSKLLEKNEELCSDKKILRKELATMNT